MHRLLAGDAADQADVLLGNRDRVRSALARSADDAELGAAVRRSTERRRPHRA